MLLSGVRDIKPEFMLVGRKSGPDLQRVPAVATQTQAHFLEVPMGNVAVLFAALVNGLDFAQELRFLGVEGPLQRGGQTAGQAAEFVVGFICGSPRGRNARTKAAN